MKLSYNAFLKVIIAIASKYNCSLFVFLIFNLSAWGNIFFISSFQSIKQIMPLLYLNSNSFPTEQRTNFKCSSPSRIQVPNFLPTSFSRKLYCLSQIHSPRKREKDVHTHTHRTHYSLMHTSLTLHRHVLKLIVSVIYKTKPAPKHENEIKSHL